MKFIIIGLGHFGSALAEKLTHIGHQVVAVDSNMRLVELVKDGVTHAVCLNSKDPLAIKNLPLEMQMQQWCASVLMKVKT